MKLKILSWNCHSLQNRVQELSHLLDQNPFHVILLQETWLNAKVTIKIPNYFCLRQDRKTDSRYPHGGVAILIHNSLKSQFNRVKFVELNSFESIFVHFSSSTFPFTIGSVYAPPKLTATETKEAFSKLFSRPGPFVIAGDFNARHTSWNNVNCTTRGKDLLRISNANLCEIHFSEEPTTFPAVGGPSLLDMVISKGSTGISKPVAINDLSSDHIPISFEIPTTSLDFPESIKIQNFTKANWKLFRSVVTSDIEAYKKTQIFFNTPTEIDKHIEMFNSIVNNAVSKAIPTMVPKSFRYPDSPLIRQLKSKRNAFRKNVKSFPNFIYVVRDLNRDIRLETMKIRQRSWNDFVAKLNIEDLSFFRITKSIKNKRIPFPPLKVADDIIFSDKGKADAIALNFSLSHQISRNPTVHSQAVSDSKQHIDQTPTNFPESEKITLNEILKIIEASKVKKATGHDKISNRILKNIPAIAVEFLLRIFNACLRTSYFPTTWKLGKVVAIAKPGKDHSLPGSYRPITLLPTIGKIFEKLILSRMSEFESENQILKNQQFGFRSKHSTTQQVLRITETISLRFNENKSTAMTLLDIEKAFDSVWHDALVHKLKLHDFPMYQTKIIISFLENRVSYVSIDNKNSEYYHVPAGVPQGSPLSPFLFNIFINDIPIPKQCKVAIYADDTALTSSINNYELPKLVKRMESGLAEIKNNFSSWKVKLNEAKTETILFTKSQIMNNIKGLNRISFNDSPLEWQQTVKYLGITLDSKLTFRANIAESHLKARKAMASIYCLLKRNSSLSQRCKLTLYRSYIRPIMTYACPIFSNCADCHMRRLQTLQNKCLRMVLNAPFRTRITTLHKKTGIPMIKPFMEKLTKNFYKQSAKSSNKLVSRLGDYSRMPGLTHPKHKLPRPI